MRGMLADKYLPNFHYRTTHRTVIRADANRIWPLLDVQDFGNSWVIRLLFLLRGMPRRSTSAAGLRRIRFVRLEQIEGKEMLTGLIGQFWRPSGKLIAFDPKEFSLFDRPGFAKGTWSFELLPMEDGSTNVVTETRVCCTDEVARKKFSRYWFFVKPFSGIVRREILKELKRKAESLH